MHFGTKIMSPFLLYINGKKPLAFKARKFVCLIPLSFKCVIRLHMLDVSRFFFCTNPKVVGSVSAANTFSLMIKEKYGFLVTKCTKIRFYCGIKSNLRYLIDIFVKILVKNLPLILYIYFSAL